MRSPVTDSFKRLVGRHGYGRAARPVATIDQQVCALMCELKRLQVETQTELDALLPSILDRAFRGNP
jgi:hypothetical protein